MKSKKISKNSAKPAKTKIDTQLTKKSIGFIEITKKTWLELSSFWRPLAGVTAVYAVLYFVFVMSLTLNSNVKELLESTEGKLPQALVVSTDTVFNSYSGSQSSDANTLLQMLLFLMATLALVWTLRRLQNLQTVTIRDAYYEGPSRIVPVIIVSLLLMLTFIPAIIGSSILSFVIQANAALVELIIAIIISIALIFGSFMLFVMYWPAFYIATLPNMRPLRAMGAALGVTKKHRLSILRKFLLLAIFCFLFIVIVVLPVALLLPAVVPYFLYVVLFALFMIVQVYLFEVYRSLV
jgi:hypothetical protein